MITTHGNAEARHVRQIVLAPLAMQPRICGRKPIVEFIGALAAEKIDEVTVVAR